MKIDIEAIDYISNVVTVARLCKIESVMIEPGIVRGLNDAQSVAIVHTENVPTFAFGSIAINRINEFISRLTIALDANAQFEASIHDIGNNKYVRSLLFKGNHISIEYRCANPTAVNAARQINDTPKYKISYGSDMIEMMKKANATMRSDKIILSADDNMVSFEMLDNNNDIFSFEFSDDVECIVDAEDEVNFTHHYTFDLLFPLLKEVIKDSKSNGDFIICQKGILNITISGLEVYVLPRV